MYGEEMGIRSRVKKAFKRIRVLAQVIHEESKYPGRPQPHVVAKNPLWGGGDARENEPKDETTENEKTESVETEREERIQNPTEKTDLQKREDMDSADKDNGEQGSLNEEGADYWFLQYDDVEGWNESNPGQKKTDKK